MKKMMLYAKEGTVVPLNEEQGDTGLLIIDEGARLPALPIKQN